MTPSAWLDRELRRYRADLVRDAATLRRWRAAAPGVAAAWRRALPDAVAACRRGWPGFVRGCGESLRDTLKIAAVLAGIWFVWTFVPRAIGMVIAWTLVAGCILWLIRDHVRRTDARIRALEHQAQQAREDASTNSGMRR